MPEPQSLAGRELNGRLAAAIYWACRMELRALKPGNVSLHAGGHGMVAADFIVSARCAAETLVLPGLGLGECVYRAIAATHAAVGCNTNLGIVLLAAPLVQAVLRHPDKPLARAVQETLAELDRTDTGWVFQAIRLASPAGLGSSETHDVSGPASENLRTVMATAASRDRIAFQYAHDFRDVFEYGLPRLASALTRWRKIEWSAVEVYLYFLTLFADTHIRRKLGESRAEIVRRESERLLALVEENQQPDQVKSELLAFDRHLKQGGINPGTSADLTVATLLAYRLGPLCIGKHSSLPPKQSQEETLDGKNYQCTRR